MVSQKLSEASPVLLNRPGVPGWNRNSGFAEARYILSCLQSLTADT
jgi:hypothetical protein